MTLQPYLPLAIGASDVTLADMVSAYSTFASGYKPKLEFYEKVLNRDGIIIEENEPDGEELLSEDDVEEMKILLKAVVEEGTAMKAKELKRPVYGKTVQRMIIPMHGLSDLMTGLSWVCGLEGITIHR